MTEQIAVPHGEAPVVVRAPRPPSGGWPASALDLSVDVLDASVDPLVSRLVSGAGRAERVRHVEALPGRAADPVDWPAWVDPAVVAAWRARGIDRPWRHQAEAASVAWGGRHVVLSSGTASGKSLAYLMPVLTAVRAGAGEPSGRGATALYVSPTKALAADQLATLLELDVPGVRAATYDGDTPDEERRWVREHASVVLTNPDLLHHSLLPRHKQWRSFLRSLRFVVVDECHHYRGVFGSHVAAVLRRLLRVAASYGASPVVVLASATASDPGDTARRLIGADVAEVTSDGSPRGRTSFVLWEPPLLPGGGENGAPTRRSATSETGELLADLVSSQVRTLAFVPSRRGVEGVAAHAARLLAEVDRSLPARVAAYRGGYLPEDRRRLEAALRSGTLLGMAATNALELGVDVAGLDAVVICGWPGRRASLWQQAGRAGRRGGDALAVFVARDDPLDTYLVHHPEAIFGQPVEATVLDPSNPYVLAPHLCAAASELPLRPDELDGFGAPRAAVIELLDVLVARGLLRRRPAGWFWTARSWASDLADLRGTGGEPVRIVETPTGRVLGTVDAQSSHHSVHEGAVHLHQGRSYLVRSLSLEDSLALVEPTPDDVYTQARSLIDIRILTERTSTPFPPPAAAPAGAAHPAGEAHPAPAGGGAALGGPAGAAHPAGEGEGVRMVFGSVEVTEQVVSFVRRDTRSGTVLGEEPLDLPPRTLRTAAVWWTVPEHLLAAAGIPPDRVPGAAHAAEHAAIGMLPLVATCDRWDIGGVSTALHPDTGMPTIFVHDGHPGGAGFAERGYHAAETWLRATLDTITECPCPEGCPSCVQSPKCGNGNNPLDKPAAARLLRLLLAHPTP